ncbi:MAG: hypothetical protein RIF41_01470 [Polyangiaceae bacterium]
MVSAQRQGFRAIERFDGARSDLSSLAWLAKARHLPGVGERAEEVTISDHLHGARNVD